MSATQGCAAGPGSLTGVWGGDRTMLTLDEAGGRLQSDCAEGRFTSPLATDSSGRFEVQGSYQAFGGGPQAADEQVPHARYSGQVDRDTLVLTIRPDGNQAAQTVTLKRGVRLKIIRCL